MIIGGDQYITYEEAQTLCCCSRSRIQRAAREFGIRKARPGRLTLLRRTDVLAWLESLRTQPYRRLGRPRQYRERRT